MWLRQTTLTYGRDRLRSRTVETDFACIQSRQTSLTYDRPPTILSLSLALPPLLHSKSLPHRRFFAYPGPSVKAHALGPSNFVRIRSLPWGFHNLPVGFFSYRRLVPLWLVFSFTRSDCLATCLSETIYHLICYGRYGRRSCLSNVVKLLSMPPTRAYKVATFHTMFNQWVPSLFSSAESVDVSSQ